MRTKDWNVAAYQRFGDLRLRPARDLALAVPDLPPGDIIDLGCGAGAACDVLRGLWPDRQIIGVDNSATMLGKATGYDALIEADITEWLPDTPPALIFSNAVLHWLPEHAAVFVRLTDMLTPGGTLAVQMPRQTGGPSHRLIREVAAATFPDRFDYSQWRPQVASPSQAWPWLSPLGAVDMWETEYIQALSPVETGHPVRNFTQSTACRPVLDRLDPPETEQFFTAYDAALADAYPLQADGKVLFPFLRQFIIITL